MNKKESQAIIKNKLCEMIDNEGVVFFDKYGRRWKYENFNFWFSDIGNVEFIKGLKCIHLLDSANKKK